MYTWKLGNIRVKVTSGAWTQSFWHKPYSVPVIHNHGRDHCLYMSLPEPKAAVGTNVSNYPKAGCKEVWTMLFSGVSSDRTRSNGHKLEYKRFPLNIGNTLLCRLRSTGKSYPERLLSTSPWRYSKNVWTWSWTTCSRWPPLSWTRWAPEVSYNLIHSVILW